MKKPALIAAASAIAALTMGAGVAFAQTTKTEAQPALATKVETWTTEQWNAAKADWSKQKIKWAGCQRQATEQNLAGRESWSFLYTCMTTSSSKLL